MLGHCQADATINSGSKVIDAAASSAEEREPRYHDQAISQANILFWFSLAIATAGFTLISYVVLRGSHVTDTQLLLKLLPGTAVEFVAVLFFKQAREVRQRATALYDRMRMDRWLKDVTVLADSIDDPKIRSDVKARLAFQMINLLSTSSHIENRSLGFSIPMIFNGNGLSCRRSGTD
ncbi:MAG TPA: hypothetical protein VGC66_15400 [Pyrinomonadaceae bacterium]|jgi:hypothetical protein